MGKFKETLSNYSQTSIQPDQNSSFTSPSLTGLLEIIYHFWGQTEENDQHNLTAFESQKFEAFNDVI